MTMKKKQSSIFYNPCSLMRETDPQDCRSKKIDQLNRPKTDNHSAYVDGFARDHENRGRDFIEKEAEDILQHQPGSVPKDTDSLSSAGYAKDNRCGNLEHDHSMVGESENGYDVLEDICVVNRIPKLKSLSIDGMKDQSGHSLLEPLNDEHHDKASNSKGINAAKYASEEESNGEVVAEEKLKSPLESFFAENAVKHYGLEDSVQESEGKTVTDASDRRLLRDFSTQSPQRHFLNSSNGEGNEVKQPSDQISSSKAVSKGDEAMRTTNLDYDSDMGSGSDAFSSMAMAANVANGRTDIAKDRSIDPVNVLNQKDAEGKQVYCHSSNNSSIGKAHKPSLSYTESVSSKKAIDECAHSEPPDRNKQEESAQFNHHQFASSGHINNSGDRYDVGESSFSAAKLDAHSMAIAFPGNVSLRSDSSTTSARSFTFPILQPESNSSPARLARTSEKRFQKNKSRKPGLFCCGF